MVLEISELCGRLGNVPLVIAGDIFDDGWREAKCSPELINFAYELFCTFPKVFVIAGQHDLPNHRFDQLEKSAIHTLVCTGKVQMLFFDIPFHDPEGRYTLSGVSWNEEDGAIPDPIKMRTKDGRKVLNVIALHANVWHHERTRHKDSKEDEFTDAWRDRLKGYDVAVFGDNHKGFLTEGKPIIYNTGGPLNRNSDEKGTKRHVGILYSDGTVEKHFLNQKEKWKSAEELVAAAVQSSLSRLDSDEFLSDLADSGAEFFDFCSEMLRHLKRKNVREEVRQYVAKILDEAKEG